MLRAMTVQRKGLESSSVSFLLVRDILLQSTNESDEHPCWLRWSCVLSFVYTEIGSHQ